MYAERHLARDAARLPLNLLDALRAYEADTALAAAMGGAFSAAYFRLNHQEWQSYASHIST